MVKTSSDSNVPFSTLMDHFKDRGVDNQRHLAKILKRDPADISKFLNGAARDTMVISICADISKMFGVVVIDYPSSQPEKV